MPATSENRLAKGIRWAARIVGGLIAVMAVAMLFAPFLRGEVELTEIEGYKAIVIYLQDIFMWLSAIVVVVGYIVSWWRVLPAGILLVLAGLAVVVNFFLPASFRTPFSQGEPGVGVGFVLVGLPFLVVGVLFLSSWWLSRKTS